MYCVIGGSLFSIFDDEFSDVGDLGKNCIAAGLAGSVYKMTRGFKGSLVGGVVGMGIVSCLHIATEELRNRDIIDFEMKFE